MFHIIYLTPTSLNSKTALFRSQLRRHFLFSHWLSSPYRQQPLLHLVPHGFFQASTGLYQTRYSTHGLLSLLPASCLAYSFTLKMEDIYIPLKHQTLSRIHSVNTQKTVLFIATAVRTSNLIYEFYSNTKSHSFLPFLKRVAFMPPSKWRQE